MIVRNLIYMLQSEQYDCVRFLRFVYTHPKWWSFENRQKIVWTVKARLLWVLTIVLFLVIGATSLVSLGVYGIVVIGLSLLLLPFIVECLLLFLLPVDILLKRRKIGRAGNILRAGKVAVIGITGSYGKTSTKEILATMIAKKFSVIYTPENINTDIGIADFIIDHADDMREKEVFIVEMGAYKKGDVAAICAMVRPKYSILTGINESHLERFGSLENIIQGKFELPSRTEKLAVLNFDDENIQRNANRFSLNRYQGVSRSDVIDIVPKEKFGGLRFGWQSTKFETTLLAEHNITLILLCSAISQELGLTLDEIRDAVADIRQVPHRLELLYNAVTDITIIDDSYNGNKNGIESGLQVLSRASGRKVVLTPGLVELGSSSCTIHNRIGQLYAKQADLVLLIKSPATPYIIDGMESSGFTQYRMYETTQAAHADLGNVLKKGDTIIFQNDFTDNYF